MITALDAQWNRISEPTKHQIGPGSERHHGFARAHYAVIGIHAPAAGRLFERSRIAYDEAAALAPEQRGIGLGQSAGVGNKSWCRKMDRAGEFTPQVGLAQLDRSVVEHLACDAILLRPFEIA